MITIKKSIEDLEILKKFDAQIPVGKLIKSTIYTQNNSYKKNVFQIECTDFFLVYNKSESDFNVYISEAFENNNTNEEFENWIIK